MNVRMSCLAFGLAVSLSGVGCGDGSAPAATDGQEATAQPSDSAGIGGATSTPTGPAATGSSSSASDGRRIRVVKKDGTKSPLFQKVVVTNIRAKVYTPSPGENPNNANPWSIFYRLTTTDGKAEVVKDNVTYWCVGDPDGKELGWIDKTFLTKWNTRFLLQPIAGAREDHFQAKRDAGGTMAHEKGKGNRTWCFIREAPLEEKGDDTVYPIILYAGQVREEGQQSIDNEKDVLKSLGLEIVFVVESSEQMHINYGTADAVASPTSSVQKIATQWQAALSSNPKLSDRVKLGLVEYQDDNIASRFAAKITVPLTNNTNEFVAAVNGLKDPKNYGDTPSLNDIWATDAVAGLNAAISEVKWSKNTSKHIIVIGCTMPQTEAKGGQRNPLNSRPHSFEQLMSPGGSVIGGETIKVFDFGYNSTRLTIKQLMDRAAPVVGDDYREATAQKMIHAVNVGVDYDVYLLNGIFSGKKDEKSREFFSTLDDVSGHTEAEIRKGFNGLGAKYVKVLVFSYLRKALAFSSREADKVFRGFADGNRGSKGLYIRCAPNRAAIDSTVVTLDKAVNNAFSVMSNIDNLSADDDSLNSGGNEQALSGSIWKIVDANGVLIRDKGVQFGSATIRNPRGVKWAERRVLVGRDELQKLDSSLLAMYDGFKDMVRKAKRQDVGAVLAKLQAICAGATSGQTFKADSSLQDAITDLPLRTAALQSTPKSLAVMSGPNFRAWLGKIQTARTRCQDLLQNKDRTTWFQLNELAPQSKFTVLKLSQLP